MIILYGLAVAFAYLLIIFIARVILSKSEQKEKTWRQCMKQEFFDMLQGGH